MPSYEKLPTARKQISIQRKGSDKDGGATNGSNGAPKREIVIERRQGAGDSRQAGGVDLRSRLGGNKE